MVRGNTSGVERALRRGKFLGVALLQRDLQRAVPRVLNRRARIRAQPLNQSVVQREASDAKLQ